MKKGYTEVTADQFIAYMESGEIPENLCVTESVYLKKKVFSKGINLGNTIFKKGFYCNEATFNSFYCNGATFTGNFRSTNMQLIKSFQLWYTTDRKLRFNWLDMN